MVTTMRWMLVWCGLMSLGGWAAGEGEINNDPNGLYKSYMTGPRAWALAASGMLTEFNSNRHDTLAIVGNTEIELRDAKEGLIDDWGISNRKELLYQLDRLDKAGHRKGFLQILNVVNTLQPDQLQDYMAKNCKTNEQLEDFLLVIKYKDQVRGKGIVGWDLARAIYLCRHGAELGYITEQEAWERIMRYAVVLQKVFNSWEDLGRNYLIGREYWSKNETVKTGESMQDAFQRLLEMKDSPWNRLDWDMELMPGTKPLPADYF